MATSVRLALLLALALGLAGCRQADGPIPAPVRDQSNEIGDIARDLINVANKDAQAPDELRSDLAKYASRDEHVRLIDDLAGELAQSLAGARVEDQVAQNLAKVLWVGLTAKQLSERQVKALEREITTTLASTGVTEERAKSIADRLTAVQKAITDNPRRWYQLF